MSNWLNRRAWLQGVLLVTVPMGSLDCASAKDPRRGRLIASQTRLPVPVRSMTLRSEKGAPVPVSAIAIHPVTAELVIACDDETIRRVNPRSMRVAQTIGSHRDRIRTLAFDSTGSRLASAGNDGQLIIWDASDNYKIKQRMEETPAIARVCFAPTLVETSHDEIAAVGFDNEVFLIGEARKTTARPRKLTCQCRDLRAVTYRADGEVIAVGGRSGDLHLFNANDGRILLDQNIHRGRINDAMFANTSSLLLTVGDDGYLCVFDTQQGKTVRRARITTGKLFSLAMLSSDLVAVAGSDNDIRIVNLDDGTVVGTLQGHRGSIPSLVVGEGYLYSGGFDATLKRWSIESLSPHEQRIAESTVSEKK